MKGNHSKAAQEPVGIIISGMPYVEQPTVFSAYIWAPAPATPEDNGSKPA